MFSIFYYFLRKILCPNIGLPFLLFFVLLIINGEDVVINVKIVSDSLYLYIYIYYNNWSAFVRLIVDRTVNTSQLQKNWFLFCCFIKVLACNIHVYIYCTICYVYAIGLTFLITVIRF